LCDLRDHLDVSRCFNLLVVYAEFKPYQEVDVMAKVSGYIKEINVDVGDRVTQGQRLATLEIPEMADDLRRADAAVVRAKAEVARAQDEQHRAESVHSLAHLSFQRLSTVAKKSPDWSRNRRSTRPRAGIWSRKRRLPRQSPPWSWPRNR
jgi:multidrug efflux pump subunit AcrA (membrane-fusion protein)